MYDIIVWNNEYENYNVSIQNTTLSVPKINGSVTNIQDLIAIGDEGLEVDELVFSKKVKKAERQDYIIATLSGLVTAAFNFYVVGSSDVSSFDPLDKENQKQMAAKILSSFKCSDKEAQAFVSTYETSLEDIGRGAKLAVRLADDFRKRLSVSGFLFSLFSKLSGYVIGKDKNGKIVCVPDEDASRLKNKTFQQRVTVAITSWFFDAVDEYMNSDAVGEEDKQVLLRFKQGLSFIKDSAKSLSKSALYTNKKHEEEKEELHNWIVDVSLDVSAEKGDLDIQKVLAKQTVSIVLNKCLVRSYLFIRNLVRQIKEKKVNSLRGIQILDLSLTSDSNKRILARLDTVSSGVFTAVNGADAMAQAYLAYKADEENGKKAALMAFLSRINIANVLDLVTVVKVDSQYIKEDFLESIDKATLKKCLEQEAQQRLNKEILSKYWCLNKIEERILYSLELDLVNRDIALTKDSKTQVKKTEWKEEWIKVASSSSMNEKLFETDSDKVYKLLVTHASPGGPNIWLYVIVIELLQFKPYFDLPYSTEEGTKYHKYSGLRLTNGRYLEEIFSAKQNEIDYKEVKSVQRVYKKSYDYLGTNVKAAVIIPAVVTVMAGIAAYLFAPGIAIALAGKSFAGLYGAALESASLAYFGGGAISAGGLGIAGGTTVIAGGGSVLGLSSSGAATIALSLLTSPSYTRKEYAKFLTVCEYVLIKKAADFEDVKAITEQLRQSTEELRGTTKVWEQRIENNAIGKDEKKSINAAIKEQNKSIQIMEKACKRLEELLK